MIKKIALFILVLFTLVSILFYVYFPSSGIQGNSIREPYNGLSSPVTEETLPSYLALTSAVSDLPRDSIISLKTSQKSYSVRKGLVVEGEAENPDITISIPSSYIPQLSNGFCQTLSNAYKKGDLNIQIRLSKASAAWKYKSMYKYRSCIGI